MLRSLDIAISGMQADQTCMDVISNNIANANTVGFKKNVVNFTDLLYDKMGGGAPGSAEGSAGINPMSVGLGVKINSINAIHTQGILTSTGKDLDMAIQGEGYFVVTNGKGVEYTRNGNFDISPGDNSLALPNGMKLMGYNVDSSGKIDTSKGVTIIHIPNGKDSIAKATEKLQFSNNIDRSMAATDKKVIPFYVVDSVGAKHSLNLTLTQNTPGKVSYSIDGESGLSGNTGEIDFDSNGKYVSMTGGPLKLTPSSAASMNVTLDFSGVTNFDKTSDLTVNSQDGYTAGTLQNYSIGSDGIIQGNYSNGMTKIIGQIPLAEFQNPSGLEQIGSGLYEASFNSGIAGINSVDGKENSIVSKYLESSNVDLTQEITNMIKADRMYQIDAKIITTADGMMENLANIKR